MTQAEQVYLILENAIHQAGQDHERYQKHLSGRLRTNNDPGWHKRLSDVLGTDLPVFLGDLIRELDLQREFQGLGQHVRSFQDAESVLHHMKGPILAKLKHPQIEKSFKPIEKLIALSNEMPRIIAGLIVDPVTGNVYN